MQSENQLQQLAGFGDPKEAVKNLNSILSGYSCFAVREMAASPSEEKLQEIEKNIYILKSMIEESIKIL